VPIADPRLIDLERIEVLRGPQGTLYGASALAGAIRVITDTPNFDTYQAMVTARYGQTEYGGDSPSIEALVNIPVSSKFAMRLSGYQETLAGYVDLHLIDIYGNPTGEIIEDADEQTTTGGRLVAAWQVADNFEITGTLMGENMKLDNNAFLHVPTPGGVPQSPLGIAIGAPAYPPLDGPADQDFDDPIFLGRYLQPSESDYLLGSIRFDWKISDSAELVSNFSIWDDGYHTDTDGTESFAFYADQGPFVMNAEYNTENSEFTNETRIQSTWAKPFQYTVGFFYQDRDERYYTRFPTPEGVTMFGFPSSDDGFMWWSESERLRKETALFGQVSYDFSQKWRGLVGARFFNFDFSSWDHFRGNGLFITGGETFTSGAADATDWVPNLNLQYRPAKNTLLYATAAEGFRMGGTNFPLPDTPACRAQVRARIGTDYLPASYQSDSLWNYELGLKKGLAKGRVTTNVAVFQMDWDQTQVSTGSLCGLSGSVINVGSVKSEGAEFELQAAVTSRFTLGFSAAYIDARIQEDYTPPGSTRPPMALEGQSLPNIPKWSWNIIGQWVFPVSGRVQGFVRGDYSYRDQTSRTAFGGAASRYSDEYGLLNLRTGVFWSRWEFAVFVENATNELPSIFGRPSVSNTNGFRNLDITLRPRTIGLTAIWRY
jgi:outer membrane receptor protein involved in Fe transport